MPELNLDDIAARLESLEETIIHRLIDRAQWCVNNTVYQHGKSGFPGADSYSLFEWRLRRHEEMDAEFGRFCVPDERPFNKNLPKPLRMAGPPDTDVHLKDYDAVNLTEPLLKSYMLLLPKICPAGNDGQYGSSVEHDVYALQAIARRIHCGAIYVAESKFRQAPDGYKKLVEARDKDGLMERLTRKDVEMKIIKRVKVKVKSLQAKVKKSIRKIVSSEPIIAFYKDVLIPLTKEGEVLYLLNRMENGSD
ncbi:chorismate mutase [Fibrobacteres bacterium R8-0-B4]